MMKTPVKQLKLRQLEEPTADKDFSSLELHPIDSDCWNYGVDIMAVFGLAYDPSSLYLRFEVQESNIKAVYREFNEPVYEDSCVEFFISFENGFYYNLEFNCIGNILGAYGKNRENRLLLDGAVLGSIQTIPSLGKGKIRIEDRDTRWTLNVRIPISVFKFTEMERFENRKATGNFYKCGDKQVFPHYLSWSPITSENPDFHRPDYFGELLFV